jgi:hypothetical protein
MPSSQSPSQLSSVITDSKLASLQRLRKLSRLLDNAISIPGTTFRIGLDPILGLLPGAGDFVGTALSAYIVIEAARLGLPRDTLGRMVFNILTESVLGVVPVLGDLFDFAWKANTKNMELLEAHLNVPRESEKASRWFVFLLLAGLIIFGVGLVSLSVLVIRLLVSAVSG